MKTITIIGAYSSKSSVNLINRNKADFIIEGDEFHRIDYSFLNRRYFEKKFVSEICGFGGLFGGVLSGGLPH